MEIRAALPLCVPTEKDNFFKNLDNPIYGKVDTHNFVAIIYSVFASNNVNV